MEAQSRFVHYDNIVLKLLSFILEGLDFLYVICIQGFVKNRYNDH